jgi:hypothetical protein
MGPWMTGDRRQLFVRLLYLAYGWTGNGVEGSYNGRRRKYKTMWVEKKMVESGRTPGETDILISTTDDEWTDGQRKRERKFKEGWRVDHFMCRTDSFSE